MDERAKRLVRVARQCRDAGIAILRPGVPIAAIGAAVQYYFFFSFFLFIC